MTFIKFNTLCRMYVWKILPILYRYWLLLYFSDKVLAKTLPVLFFCQYFYCCLQYVSSALHDNNPGWHDRVNAQLTETPVVLAVNGDKLKTEHQCPSQCRTNSTLSEKVDNCLTSRVSFNLLNMKHFRLIDFIIFSDLINSRHETVGRLHA